MLWHFAVKSLLATNFVPKSAVVTRPASWPRVRDSITSVWFSIHWRLERGALAPSGMRNSRDSLSSSRAWFDHSGLRYAQTSNPNHAVVRYAHSLGWVFPKWRVVSWRTRVREARMMRLTYARVHAWRECHPKMRDRPAPRMGSLQRTSKFQRRKYRKPISVATVPLPHNRVLMMMRTWPQIAILLRRDRISWFKVKSHQDADTLHIMSVAHPLPKLKWYIY